MKPSISLHGIRSIVLTDPLEFEQGPMEYGPFAARTLTLTDANGDTFHLELFGVSVEALTLPVERAAKSLANQRAHEAAQQPSYTTEAAAFAGF